MTLTAKLAPPVMIGLPRESCAAMRKDAASPATAEVSPSPVAWQHARDTCTAHAALERKVIQPAYANNILLQEHIPTLGLQATYQRNSGADVAEGLMQRKRMCRRTSVAEEASVKGHPGIKAPLSMAVTL